MHRVNSAAAKNFGACLRSARYGASWGLLIVLALSFATVQADEAQPRLLFVVNRDGSGLRHVVQIESVRSLGAPRWSHDGKRLAFDARSDDPTGNCCFIADLDGANLTEAAPGALPDWSPDDKQLAFEGGPNTSLKHGIWVQNTGGQGRQYLAPGTAPHWSPDGSQIARIAGTLRILDLTQGAGRDVLTPDAKLTCPSPSFDWAPDGARLALVVERDGAREVVIVDAVGEKPSMRTRLKAAANGVAWSHDGKTLAVSIRNEATGEHRIHLLPADGESPPAEIPGQLGDNREVAWSPDDGQLAFTGTRRDIALKPVVVPSNRATLEKVAFFDSRGTCYSLAMAPDGRTALLGANLGNKAMQVWDVQTGAVLRTINMVGVFVAVSPNGKEAACWQLPKPSVTYFNLDDGTIIRELETGGMVIFLSISSDGSRLVCGTRNGVALVFDLATGNEIRRIKHEQPVGNGALSPDGSVVATAAGDKLYLWEAASGKMLHEAEHPSPVWGVTYSPDGTLVATGTGGAPIGDITDHRYPVGDDNSIRLWDATTGKLVRELKGHTHAVTTLAFSPDGSRLASGSLDGTLRLWKTDNGQELDQVGGRSWIMKLAYSSNGSQILTAGGNFRETPTARKLIDVPEERVRVYQVVPAQNKAPDAKDTLEDR